MPGEPDEFERILDAALSTYSSAGPLAGLEGRIMQRVHLAQRRRRAWRWIGVAAIAAAIGVCALLWRTPAPSGRAEARLERPKIAPKNSPTSREPLPNAPVIPVRRTAPRRARSAQPRSYPRQQRFPVPTPLTDEERVLVALVVREPDLAREVVLAHSSSERIDIQPLQIEPLPQSGADNRR